MAYTYQYPHPAVTVDIAVLSLLEGQLKVLLIERAREPFKGMWALPGGFVEHDESLKRAAYRELREETGVKAGYISQLGAFGRPDRDPRERVITVVYIALVAGDELTIEAADDARDARWFVIDELPELACDHAKILAHVIERLREKLIDPVVATQLLPAAFTMADLQRVHEQVRGVELDKRNFSKKTKALDILEPTGEMRRDGPHRPARLFRLR